MLLAGNIGGTKTDLAAYTNDSGPYAPLAETEVHSAEYASLTAITGGSGEGEGIGRSSLHCRRRSRDRRSSEHHQSAMGHG